MPTRGLSATVFAIFLLFQQAASGASVLVFPQIIQGPSLSTSLVLMDSGSAGDSGAVEFFDSSGQPFELSVEGTLRSSLPYTVPASGHTVIELAPTETLRTGYALARSSQQGSQPSGLLRIVLGNQDLLFLDAPQRNQHLLFLKGTTGRAGLAVVNLSPSENSLAVEILNGSGAVTALQTLTLTAGGQRAVFADQIFEGSPLPEESLLRIRSSGPSSLIGIRENSDGTLLALPISGSTGIALPPGPELFSGELALGHVEAQLAHGPRPTGSSALLKAGDEILSTLRDLGWTVRQDLHTLDLDTLQIPVRNLEARMGQGAPVILAAHYDTRIWADQDPNPALRMENVPGANDGGSGVAVLLELARLISQHYLPNNEIRLLFFDAEDNGDIPPWSGRSESVGGWIIGSSLYASGLDPEAEGIQFMILVDMVGDMNQRFPQEASSRSSAPDLVTEIWNTAATLGFEEIFVPQAGLSILDDHIPFIDLGLPAVDIIDLDYPFWHTTQDTLDKVSPDSLQRVGRVLQTLLTEKGVIRRKGF